MNSKKVEYLLIGGYAVNFHGYARATADMDIWIATDPGNASLLSDALREFGFSNAAPNLFLVEGKIIRMGVPPMRIEILTGISGVTFEECFRNRVAAEIDGVPVNVIDLDSLKRNKRASGRWKDLADLQELD